MGRCCGDERGELGPCRAAVDCLLGQLHAVLERVGLAAGDNRRGGVEGRRVTVGALLAAQDAARDRRVLFGRAAGNRLDRVRAAEEPLGIDGRLEDVAVLAQNRQVGEARDAQLVQVLDRPVRLRPRAPPSSNS